MTESARDSDPGWLEPADDAPELTDDLLDVAEVSVGGAVVRPATGYLGPNGVMRSSPLQRAVTKR
ncbi:hypothetical protein [Sphingomonas echinoides]|uniref:hypothetical protein n=1 Tax=Sphingomonas echinoides TaxID=59803 RepID=UPI0024132446|nr:hypothetical protein [Sphingomonas echinoides]